MNKKNIQIQKSDHIRVGVGDLIEAEILTRSSEASKIVGKVVGVEKRYGLRNDGTIQPAPLLKVITEAGKEEQFDNGYVIAVLERNNRTPKPKNIFRETLERDPWLRESLRVKENDVVKKGVLCGTLHYLVVPFLAKMNIPLERPLDEVKLRLLFLKQKPGLVSEIYHGICYVNKKAFGKWVQKNALQICMTVSEMRIRETAENQDWEREWEREWEQDYRKSVEDERDAKLQEDETDNDIESVYDSGYLDID